MVGKNEKTRVLYRLKAIIQKAIGLSEGYSYLNGNSVKVHVPLYLPEQELP